MLRSGVAFAFALVLLTSGVHAAPAIGDLERAVGPGLLGHVRLAATEGAIDLTQAVLDGVPLRIEAAGIVGELVTYTVRHVEPARDEPVGQPRVTPMSAGPVVLHDFVCVGPCKVLLFSEGGGELVAEGRAAGALSWLEAPRRYCGYVCASEAPHFRVTLPAGAMEAGAGGTRLTDAKYASTGDLVLFLKNARLTLTDAEGARTFDATRDERGVQGVQVPGVVYESSERHVRLRLASATLADVRTDRATWVAPAAHATLTGTFTSAEATGAIRWNGERVAFEAQRVEAAGAFTLDLARLGSGGPVALAPHAAQGALAGDVTALRIDGRTIGPAPVADAGDATATATAAVGALLLAALAGLRFALPLYSRIAPGRVLAHPNRRAIMDIVREDPGLAASEIARRVGLARVVVQHHVAMLESHRLLCAKQIGREKRHYVAEAVPASDLVEADAVLADATRRRVAAAVLASGGAITQRELGERTGLSRRLVSYHLARLESVGLVTPAEGTPRTYAATRQLARAFDGRVVCG